MLDERITLRTEEYVCPATGETKVRTVEYIEKVIEKEVRAQTATCILRYIMLYTINAVSCVVYYSYVSFCKCYKIRLAFYVRFLLTMPSVYRVILHLPKGGAF